MTLSSVEHELRKSQRISATVALPFACAEVATRESHLPSLCLKSLRVAAKADKQG